MGFVDLARKFRILADIIQFSTRDKVTILSLRNSLPNDGNGMKRSEVESLTLLAIELGFLIESESGILKVTNAGLNFQRYIAAADTWHEPHIDRGNELKLCVTLPPRWKREFSLLFESTIIDTFLAHKTVAEDAEKRLVIISPFIDVAVLQMYLKDVFSKDAELTIITSEPSLVRTYQAGKNYELLKLEDLIRSRFKSGKVYHLENGASIAHAKVWCSEKCVVVTSANVKSDSTTENFEVGVYSDDAELVSTARSFFESLVKMEELKCILQVP